MFKSNERQILRAIWTDIMRLAKYHDQERRPVCPTLLLQLARGLCCYDFDLGELKSAVIRIDLLVKEGQAISKRDDERADVKTAWKAILPSLMPKSKQMIDQER